MFSHGTNTSLVPAALKKRIDGEHYVTVLDFMGEKSRGDPKKIVFE